MNSLFFTLVLIGAIATLVVLIRGVLTMASGKDITGERQNKLMVKRVALQAVTIVLAIILLLFMSVGR